MNIQKKLKELGFNSVPKAYYNLIAMWESWYRGNVKDFHNYTVYNGIEYLDCHRYSVGMAKKVSEDWANLLLNEKVKITLEGEKEQAFINQVFTDNNFWVKANEAQERKSALGTVAYVPQMAGMVIHPDSGAILSPGQLRIDICTAPYIYPLSWDNGIVRECAFVSVKDVDGKKYVYIQLHRLVNGLYDIENRLYYASEEVPLASVRGFENVPEVVHTNSAEPQFIIDRLNIANVEEDNPMGVSVFAHAIDQLKGVDIAYDGYVNEFVLGKKRIVVKPEATKDINGRPVFDARETVYYALPEDSQSGSIMEQVDMSLRTEAFNAGMQDMLNVLSSKCGFGENHYKYDRGSVSTATQIVSENSTLFRTIKKHEIILRSVLMQLCRTLLRMGNAYIGAGLDEEVEISIDFDDSIIEDKETDFNRDARMVSMGVMNLWEFRAKWMNEDTDTAKNSLPGMEDLSDNKEDEVE